MSLEDKKLKKLLTLALKAKEELSSPKKYIPTQDELSKRVISMKNNLSEKVISMKNYFFKVIEDLLEKIKKKVRN